MDAPTAATIAEWSELAKYDGRRPTTVKEAAALALAIRQAAAAYEASLAAERFAQLTLSLADERVKGLEARVKEWEIEIAYQRTVAQGWFDKHQGLRAKLDVAVVAFNAISTLHGEGCDCCIGEDRPEPQDLANAALAKINTKD